MIIMEQMFGLPPEVDSYQHMTDSSQSPDKGKTTKARNERNHEKNLTDKSVLDFVQEISDVDRKVTSQKCLETEDPGDLGEFDGDFERDLCHVNSDSYSQKHSSRKTVAVKKKKKLQRCATWECTSGGFPKVVIRSKSASDSVSEKSSDRIDMSDSIEKEKCNTILELEKGTNLISDTDKFLTDVHDVGTVDRQDSATFDIESRKRNETNDNLDTFLTETNDNVEGRFGGRMDTVGEVVSRKESSIIQQEDFSSALNLTKDYQDIQGHHQNDQKSLKINKDKFTTGTKHFVNKGHSNRYLTEHRHINTDDFLGDKHALNAQIRHKREKKQSQKKVHHKNCKSSGSSKNYNRQSKHTKSSHHSSKHKKHKRNHPSKSKSYVQDIDPRDKDFIDYCLHKYYRLRQTRWKNSSIHALKLLKKKYRSLRILFCKEPTLMLKRVPERNIFEAIEHMATDENDNGDKSKEEIKPVEETASLVDPRVMSLSRALQSGRNGKVGIEKTFKTVHVKPAKSKIKKASDTPFKKPNWVIKPEWSRKTLMLSRKVKPKHADSINDTGEHTSLGKEVKNRSFKTTHGKKKEGDRRETKSQENDNTDWCSNLVKTVSVDGKGSEGKGSLSSSRSAVAGPLLSNQTEPFHLSLEENNTNVNVKCSGNSIIANTQGKPDNLAQLRKRFEANENDTSVYNIGEYQIEICRDSPIESDLETDYEDLVDDLITAGVKCENGWQSNFESYISRDSKNQNLNQAVDFPEILQAERDLKRLSSGLTLSKAVNLFHAGITDAALTVTSDIIPNLCNAEEEITPVLDQTEMSPPILKREIDENTDETSGNKRSSPQNETLVSQKQESLSKGIKHYESSNIENEDDCDVFAPVDEDYIIFKVDLDNEDLQCCNSENSDSEIALDLSVKSNSLDFVIESVHSIHTTHISENISNGFKDDISKTEYIKEKFTKTINEREKVKPQPTNKDIDHDISCQDSTSTFAGGKEEYQKSAEIKKHLSEKPSDLPVKVGVSKDNSLILKKRKTDQTKLGTKRFVPFKLKKRKVLGRPAVELVKDADKTGEKRLSIKTENGQMPGELVNATMETQVIKTGDILSEDRQKSVDEVKKEPGIDGLCKYSEIVELSSDSESGSKRLFVKEEIPTKKKLKSPRCDKKRRKTLNTQSPDDDSEELPKIPPPKRRSRLPCAAASHDRKMVDMTEERLMQDFPKHNWLFNKYSETHSGSSESAEKKDVNIIEHKTSDGKTSKDAKPSSKHSKLVNQPKVKLQDSVSQKVKDSTMTASTTVTITSQCEAVTSPVPNSDLYISSDHSSILISNSPSPNISETVTGETGTLSPGCNYSECSLSEAVAKVNNQEVSVCPPLLAIAISCSPHVPAGDQALHTQFSDDASVECLASEIGIDLTMDTEESEVHTVAEVDTEQSDLQQAGAVTDGKTETENAALTLDDEDKRTEAVSKCSDCNEKQEARVEEGQVSVSAEALGNTDPETREDGVVSKSPCESKSPKAMERPPESQAKTQTEPVASVTGKASPLDLCLSKSDLGNVSFRQRGNLPVQLVLPQVQKPPSTTFGSSPVIAHVSLTSGAHVTTAGSIQVSSTSVVHSSTPIPAHTVAFSRAVMSTSSETSVSVDPAIYNTSTSSYKCSFPTPAPTTVYGADVQAGVPTMSGIVDQIPGECHLNTQLIQTVHINSQRTDVQTSNVTDLPLVDNTESTSQSADNIDTTNDSINPVYNTAQSHVKAQNEVSAGRTSSVGIAPLPALVKSSNLSHAFPGNTGMVIPVQPIIQPLSQLSPRGQIQFVGANLSSQNFSGHSDNQLTLVNATQGSQLVCRDQVMAFSQHPPPLLYQTQPQIIQVQPQAFSPRQTTGMNFAQSPRKQNQCRKICPKPQVTTAQLVCSQVPALISVQSSQPVCLPVVQSNNSATPSCSTAFVEVSNQITGNNVLLTQKTSTDIQNSGTSTRNVKSIEMDTNHHANIVQPVHSNADLLSSEQAVMDNVKNEAKIEQASTIDKSDMYVPQVSQNTTNDDSRKNTIETATVNANTEDNNIDGMDDLNEEIRKEMEALDAEIRRKEREQEEMKKKKLELLRKVKQAKTSQNALSDSPTDSKNESTVSQEVENETVQNNNTLKDACGSKSVVQSKDENVEMKEEPIDKINKEKVDQEVDFEILCDSDASDRDSPKLIVDESRFESDLDDTNPEILEEKVDKVIVPLDQSEEKSCSDEVIDFSVRQKNSCQSMEDTQGKEDEKALKRINNETIAFPKVGLNGENDISVTFITEIENVNPFTGEYEKPLQINEGTSIDLSVRTPLPMTVKDNLQNLKCEAKQENIQTVSQEMEVKDKLVLNENPIENVGTQREDADAFLSSLDLSKKPAKPSDSLSIISKSGSVDAFLSSLDLSKKPAKPDISLSSISKAESVGYTVTTFSSASDGAFQSTVSSADTFSLSKGSPPKLQKLPITGTLKQTISSKDKGSQLITASLVSDALSALKDSSVDKSVSNKPNFEAVSDHTSTEKPDAQLNQTSSVSVVSKRVNDTDADSSEAASLVPAKVVESTDILKTRLQESIPSMDTPIQMNDSNNDTSISHFACDMRKQSVTLNPEITVLKDNSVREHLEKVENKTEGPSSFSQYSNNSSKSSPNDKGTNEKCLTSSQTESSQLHNEPRRKTRMKFVELLPAHYNHVPKKVTKLKPDPAHQYVSDVKDILKKLAKSIVKVPTIIQQSCPYISRKKGCFSHPAETDSKIPRPWQDRPPAPAHSQKPFQIPGYLIVTSKKSGRKRKLSEEPRSQFSGGSLRQSISFDKTVPHTAPSLLVSDHGNNKSRHHSMSPPSHSKRGRIQSYAGPSPTKSQLSPVAAHCKPQMFIGNKDLHMTQILRPPALVPDKIRSGSTSMAPENLEVVDLTADYSMSPPAKTSLAPECAVETERTIQQELTAALAKRQRMDMLHQIDLTGGSVSQQYVDMQNSQGYSTNNDPVRQQPVNARTTLQNNSSFLPPNVALSQTQPVRQQVRRMSYDQRMYSQPNPQGVMARPADQQMSNMRYRDLPQSGIGHRPMVPQQASLNRVPVNRQQMNSNFIPAGSQQTSPTIRPMEKEGYQGRHYNHQQMNPNMRQMDHSGTRDESRQIMRSADNPMNHSTDVVQHGVSAGYQPQRMQPPMLLQGAATQNLGYYRDKRRVQPQLRYPNQGLHGVDFSPVADQSAVPMSMNQQKQQVPYSRPENMRVDGSMPRTKFYPNPLHAQQSPRLPPSLMTGYQPQAGMVSPGSQQNAAPLHHLLQQKHPQFPVPPQVDPQHRPTSMEEQARLHKMKQVRAQFIKSQQILRKQCAGITGPTRSTGPTGPTGPGLSPQQTAPLTSQMHPPQMMNPLLYMQKEGTTSAQTVNVSPSKPTSHNPPTFIQTPPTQQTPANYMQPYPASTSQNQPALDNTVNPGTQRWDPVQSGYHHGTQQADQQRTAIVPQHQHQQQQQQAHHQSQQHTLHQPPSYNQSVSPEKQQHFQQQQQYQQPQQFQPPQQYPPGQPKSYPTYNGQGHGQGHGQGQGQVMPSGNSPQITVSQQVVYTNPPYLSNSTMVTGGHLGSPGSQAIQRPQEQHHHQQQQQQQQHRSDKSEEDMPHLQQIHGACIICGKFSLYLCSNCKQIWYCSPECQLNHWQTHSIECKGDGT